MPDWEYRKFFRFEGGTPGKGAGSLWRCSFCEKIVCASWGHAAKHYWKHVGRKVDPSIGKLEVESSFGEDD